MLEKIIFLCAGKISFTEEVLFNYYELISKLYFTIQEKNQQLI